MLPDDKTSISSGSVSEMTQGSRAARTGIKEFVNVFGRDASRPFYDDVREPVLDAGGHLCNVLGVKVVEHDHLGAGSRRLDRLLERPHLDLDLERKTANAARALHRLGDGPRAPHVVVLEHDHRRQIHAVRVNAANQHRVLFNEAEAGRRLARAGNSAVPAVALLRISKGAGARRDPARASKEIQRDALALEDSPRLALNLCYNADGLKPRAFVNKPRHSAVKLAKDLIHERAPAQHALRTSHLAHHTS